MAETPHIETHDSTRPESNATESRQAVARGRVIYVLLISLGLVVAAYTAIYFL
jgi:hypothetical protein